MTGHAGRHGRAVDCDDDGGGGMAFWLLLGGEGELASAALSEGCGC